MSWPNLHDLERSAPRAAMDRRRWGLHIFLFLATCLSTYSIYDRTLSGSGAAAGFSYAGSIMAILTAHEMGHFAMCRKYRVPASLPFFIPFPITIFGTMGAVIRMGGPIWTRRVLFDIAVAGPLAGLVVAIPALAWGLARSHVVPSEAALEAGILLGDPLLLRWLAAAVAPPHPEGTSLVLHPVAFAGWAGLFVTALNLLPAGQLDGGHVIYAVAGRAHRHVTRGVVAGLAVLTIATRSMNWIFLGVLIALFGLRPHPPTVSAAPLDRRRLVLAVFMLVVFVLCFTPVPIQLL